MNITKVTKSVLLAVAAGVLVSLSGCTAYVDEPVARTTTYRTTETAVAPAPVATQVTTTRTY